MLDGLLSTKFFNPQTVGYLTDRPRLYARLTESLLAGCRLVLVTAPAGYGKSTLVSVWINRQATPFSWISIDSSDNEPRLFLSYLVGALQKIHPNLGMSQISRIQTADSADSEAVYADVMLCLVNEIAALDGVFYLILDDCHLLKNPLLLRLLTFLVERQPPQMRLILLSREDLPLPVSRLRVRRQLIEIRQADLQFELAETEDFLCAGMGINNLTGQDIQALEHHTEGWIAGLQLAALSLRNNPAPSVFIRSFAGSDRYILDYLLEEVFTHQPREIQDFLISTSILERFCAPLCAALLQEYKPGLGYSEAGSEQILAMAERANLFLIPLDNQRQWYRYHHLFADLLRHSLTHIAANQVSGLHLRASRWLEENGLIPEAVRHAFLSRDWQFAADLVERHAWNVILHSQVATVSEWCNTFPESVISRRPALCIFHGWAQIIGFKKNDFPAALVRIEQAEAGLAWIDLQVNICLVAGAQPVNLKRWVTGHITLLRSFILMAASRREANPQALIDLGELSYEQLPDEDQTGRSVSLLDISYAKQALCEVEEAEKRFAHVVRVASSGGNYFGAVVAEYHRAHGLFVQGRLHETIDFCRQKRIQYEGYFERPLQELPAIALLDQAEGCALLELNQVAEAERLLRAGLEVGQWMPREELPGYLALARVCFIRDDEQGVGETLRRLDLRWPDIHGCTEAVRTLYRLKRDPADLESRKAGAKWAEENPPEIGPGIVIPGFGPAWNDEADYAVNTIWIQVQILLGRAKEALEVIDPMLGCYQNAGLLHRVIDLSLLEAQAHYALGQKDRAWKPLRSALACADELGYARLADQGPLLKNLLSEALHLGISPQTIRRNLDAVLPDHSQEPEPVERAAARSSGLDLPDVDGLVEPLSSREIEVLILMGEGLSNSDIAARLYLSPNTLKSHSQNIYGKLSVHNRVQAVNKARLLKII